MTTKIVVSKFGIAHGVGVDQIVLCVTDSDGSEVQLVWDLEQFAEMRSELILPQDVQAPTEAPPPGPPRQRQIVQYRVYPDDKSALPVVDFETVGARRYAFRFPSGDVGRDFLDEFREVLLSANLPFAKPN